MANQSVLPRTAAQVGARGLAQGTVELKKRNESESREVPAEGAVEGARAALAELGA